MSNLSRREDVWSKAYVLSGENKPAEFADECLREFDKRFPAPYGFSLDSGLKDSTQYDDVAGRVWRAQPGKNWGVDHTNRMQEVARNITKFLIEKDEEELLEKIGKFSIAALERMKDVISCIIDKRNKINSQ